MIELILLTSEEFVHQCWGEGRKTMLRLGFQYDCQLGELTGGRQECLLSIIEGEDGGRNYWSGRETVRGV